MIEEIKYPDLLQKVKVILDEKEFPYRTLDLESFVNNYKAFMTKKGCSQKTLPSRVAYLFREMVHRKITARILAVNWTPEQDGDFAD